MAGAAAGVAGVLVIGARKGKYTADGKDKCDPGRQHATGDARNLHLVDGMVRVSTAGQSSPQLR